MHPAGSVGLTIKMCDRTVGRSCNLVNVCGCGADEIRFVIF